MNQLLRLDYTHPYTTDISHILTIYHFSQKYRDGIALELGSHKGHSTLALALAGLRVVSYDLDTSCISERKQLLANYPVHWNNLHSSFSLKETRTFDVIFHDADHGNTIVPEIVALWDKVNSGGIFIIHDFEQITIPTPLTNLIYQTKDMKNRQLAIFIK